MMAQLRETLNEGNFNLAQFHEWDEETIAARGASLFQTARGLWQAPERPEGMNPALPKWADAIGKKLPPEGTVCRFIYTGKTHLGSISGGAILVGGIDEIFGSFSAASKAITQTSRNGWNDWSLRDAHGGWILASEWRKKQSASSVVPDGDKDPLRSQQ